MLTFDYGSITDVLLTTRYMSLDGGDKPASIASSIVADYLMTILDAGVPDGSGLFTFFDLKADFASEWYRAGFSTAVSGRAP